MAFSRQTHEDNQSSSIYRELLSLSRDSRIDSGDLTAAFQLVTETIVRALKVSRASIWLYNSDRSAIDCYDLFEVDPKSLDSKGHTEGAQLKSESFPAYFAYLAEERVLCADDAHQDSATFEFSEVYLKPLGIASMLDAPIRLDGKMIGVICSEHVGENRVWTDAEENFIGNVADILARAFQAHERLEAKRSLQAMNEHLESLVRIRTEELQSLHSKTVQTAKLAALGEMAGGVAHEINTPLSLILILADQIQDSLESPDQVTEAKASAELIAQTVLRISKIIKGLQTFARDGSKAAMENSSLVDVAEQTLQLCGQRMQGSAINFEFVKPEGSDAQVMCRSVEISQVMLNLLNNAYDAVHEQEKPWIKLEMKESKDTVVFEVTNSGPAIPEAVRQKLFQPFFTTKAPGKGTGLGLSISKGIVDQHAGKFFVDEKSDFTKFVVELPRSL
ncbi:MAG: sensor histidine kinase [Proteobacteria bacterium]|nr:MAG: sensor histidine kinase [Pseudomonadota bacterium]